MRYMYIKEMSEKDFDHIVNKLVLPLKKVKKVSLYKYKNGKLLIRGYLDSKTNINMYGDKAFCKEIEKELGFNLEINEEVIFKK